MSAFRTNLQAPLASFHSSRLSPTPSHQKHAETAKKSSLFGSSRTQSPKFVSNSPHYSPRNGHSSTSPRLLENKQAIAGGSNTTLVGDDGQQSHHELHASTVAIEADSTSLYESPPQPEKDSPQLSNLLWGNGLKESQSLVDLSLPPSPEGTKLADLGNVSGTSVPALEERIRFLEDERTKLHNVVHECDVTTQQMMQTFERERQLSQNLSGVLRHVFPDVDIEKCYDASFAMQLNQKYERQQMQKCAHEFDALSKNVEESELSVMRNLLQHMENAFNKPLRTSADVDALLAEHRNHSLSSSSSSADQEALYLTRVKLVDLHYEQKAMEEKMATMRSESLENMNRVLNVLAENRKLQKELEQRDISLSKERIAAANVQSKLNSGLTEVMTALSDIRREKESQEARVREMEAELQVRSTSCSPPLHGPNSDLTKDRQDNLEQRISALLIEKDGLMEELERMKDQMKTVLRPEIERLTENEHRMRNVHSEVQAEAAAWKIRAQTMERDVQVLRSEANVSLQATEKQKRLLADKEVSHMQLVQALEQAQSDFQLELSAKLEENNHLQQTLVGTRKLQEDLITEKNTLERDLLNLRNENDHLNVQSVEYEELKLQHAQLNANYSSLESRLARADKDLKVCQEELADARVQADVFRNRAALAQHIATQTCDESTLQTSSNKSKAENKRLVHQVQEMSKSISELQVLIQQLHSQREGLEKECSARRMAYDGKVNETAKLLQEVSQLKGQLGSHKDQILSKDCADESKISEASDPRASAHELQVARLRERLRDQDLQLKTWAAERDTCYRVSSALRGQLAFWRERAENKRLLPRMFSSSPPPSI